MDRIIDIVIDKKYKIYEQIGKIPDVVYIDWYNYKYLLKKHREIVPQDDHILTLDGMEIRVVTGRDKLEPSFSDPETVLKYELLKNLYDNLKAKSDKVDDFRKKLLLAAAIGVNSQEEFNGMYEVQQKIINIPVVQAPSLMSTFNMAMFNCEYSYSIVELKGVSGFGFHAGYIAREPKSGKVYYKINKTHELEEVKDE